MKKLLPRLAAAAATLACVGTSHAVLVTFDAPIDTSGVFFAPLLGHTDSLTTQGYLVEMFSTKAGAQPGDLVGALVDGSNLAATCTSIVCPTNNATTFLAALNDGLPALSRVDGQTFTLSGFDASFIAAAGVAVPAAAALILRVEGYQGATLALQQDINLPGPSTAGIYSFSSYSMNAAFSSMLFTDVAFRGFACDAAGSCSRALDRAQFGLDNINVNVVPEPSEWMLMGLGLAMVGALVRRRRAT